MKCPLKAVTNALLYVNSISVSISFSYFRITIENRFFVVLEVVRNIDQEQRVRKSTWNSQMKFFPDNVHFQTVYLNY